MDNRQPRLREGSGAFVRRDGTTVPPGAATCVCCWKRTTSPKAQDLADGAGQSLSETIGDLRSTPQRVEVVVARNVKRIDDVPASTRGLFGFITSSPTTTTTRSRSGSPRGGYTVETGVHNSMVLQLRDRNLDGNGVATMPVLYRAASMNGSQLLENTVGHVTDASRGIDAATAIRFGRGWRRRGAGGAR